MVRRLMPRVLVGATAFLRASASFFSQIALELLVILGVDLGATARVVGGRGPRRKFSSF